MCHHKTLPALTLDQVKGPPPSGAAPATTPHTTSAQQSTAPAAPPPPANPSPAGFPMATAGAAANPFAAFGAMGGPLGPAAGAGGMPMGNGMDMQQMMQMMQNPAMQQMTQAIMSDPQASPSPSCLQAISTPAHPFRQSAQDKSLTFQRFA